MIYCLNLNATEDFVFQLPRIRLGEVLRAEGVFSYPGGKGGNAARTVALLGGKPKLLAFAAENSLAATRAFFKAKGVETSLVPAKGSARPCLLLYEKAGQRETVINSPSQLKLNSGHLKKLDKLLRKNIKAGDWVTLSGSLPSGLPENSLARLIATVRACGGKACVDSSGPAFGLGLKAKPYLVKPNLKELEGVVGRPIRGQQALRRAMLGLAAQGIGLVVVSLGAQGSLALCEGRFYRAKAVALRPGIQSPVGCGDAFLGGLVWALSQGKELKDSLRWATACGWANLQHLGSGFMSKREIEEGVRRIEARS